MTTPIIPWPGGKRRLAKHILPLFPEHQAYIEPFCGAAALFFMKEPVKTEVINDINGELINLYRVVKYHLDALVQEFHWSLVSRQAFEWQKKQPVVQLTDIQRAARFYYLQKLCFGARVENQTFGSDPSSPPRFNRSRFEDSLSQAHLRLSMATIEHMTWDKCIERYDRDASLFYCDPPYWGTVGYGVEFGFEQYAKLATMAKTMKGKMIISVNNISEMHQVFDGLTIRTVDTRYTIGGGVGKKASELIITNY